jgi:lipoate-protein ligase A
MAVDEAILETTIKNNLHPTLRLYSWSPACLSLGYAQPISQVDLDLLNAHKWDLVRRPTGGRAILHSDELTYSITATFDHPAFARGVLESYKHISQGLVSALQILNIGIEIQPEIRRSSDEREQAICFELPSSYEITSGGKKLIGSAQVRRRGGVLQHGSLPLAGDITRICQVLHYADEQERNTAASRLRDRATTLEERLGYAVTWQDAADAFVAGFEQALNIDFEERTLSANESEIADRICRDKYEQMDWLEKL